MDDGYEVVDLGFNFNYCDKTYTQVSISTNGYVCLGNNTECGSYKRPSPHDILVGLNHDLDTIRNGSGQIYYKSASTETFMWSTYAFVLNETFVPSSVFMITFDEVLPHKKSSISTTSFQIYLSSDSFENSYLTFKYKS